jgi:hypothetical protein
MQRRVCAAIGARLVLDKAHDAVQAFEVAARLKGNGRGEREPAVRGRVAHAVAVPDRAAAIAEHADALALGVDLARHPLEGGVGADVASLLAEQCDLGLEADLQADVSRVAARQHALRCYPPVFLSQLFTQHCVFLRTSKPDRVRSRRDYAKVHAASLSNGSRLNQLSGATRRAR